MNDGNKRFYELQQTVGTLVVVEYELTDYCQTLNDVLRSLSQWSAMRTETVKKSLRRKKAVVV